MSYKEEVLRFFPDGFADDHVDVEYRDTLTEFCVVTANPDDEDQRSVVQVLGVSLALHARQVGLVARLEEPVDLNEIPEELFENAWTEAVKPEP